MNAARDPAGEPLGGYAGLLLALNSGLALTLVVVFLGILPLIGRIAGSRDFVVYWATGQQLLHHANPYDPAAMSRLEHEAGFTGTGAYYMRNPPWSLPLALPLGLVSARFGALPWSAMVLALLWLSVRLLWRSVGAPGNRVHWFGYSFAPALLCVLMGQTSLFLLLGMALFLRLHKTNPFWAGAGLWFCSLKPHLLLPFGVALVLWIVYTRGWRILLGAASALAASALLTELVDPQAWSQYAAWAGHSGIGGEAIPCLSVALRNAIRPEAGWIAFIPSAVSCLLAAVYFWRQRQQWDWMQQGGVLTVLSLVVAPYCWIYDQSLALPALLWGASRTRKRWLLAWLAVASIVLEAQLFRSLPLTSPWYWWPAPLWLVWTLVEQRTRGEGRGTRDEG
jgi:hypothetical protein